jgi:S1-C subfamily serine protease
MSDQQAGLSGLAAFSAELSAAAGKAAASVVRVDDGSRLTASGVVWEADGMIVTTSHGVERDEELGVVTADGARHAATLLGRDPDTDIAVLKVEATGLTPIARVSAAPEIGALALAVTRPGDAGLTATLGVVSGRQDTETDGAAEYIVTTDAVLYPGASGGALVNVSGEFVGLLNRMYGGRGAGVALGVPLVARVAEQIKATGGVKRGYLGVRTQLVELPESLRGSLNVAQRYALLVLAVEPGSPAEKAGLVLGDTVLEVNGKAVEDVGELKRHLLAGKPVAVTIARGGARHELSATVGDRA